MQYAYNYTILVKKKITSKEENIILNINTKEKVHVIRKQTDHLHTMNTFSKYLSLGSSFKIIRSQTS